ncbi:hypothetical protein FHS29_004855 [Saccharothrix tamanrassetensis]|uniref:Potassium transporter TrkA n=1 Tax=Saccharothrix tamanrassetensis TaxID=1051531 RepID=A0A841CQB0_9PSEU|nr:potassium transporter TrkA [Saccharothrix tamanrassetensis]MBB5958247.1 hypothetical protein [Saccharothrix tamanrassetensis]
MHRIAVIGTGDLARAVCYSLAAVATTSVEVVVVGRSAEKTGQLCYIASARAAAVGRTGVAFTPFVGDVEQPVADVDGALVCASSQSPWERLTAPSAWTALVGRAGFGITLPFQAELALRVGRALPERSWLVNGCFPDAVNPLLAALGVPVLCGVGNIALLAASAQAALGLPDQARLRMLAHHVHLHEPAERAEEVRAWCDDEPISAPGDLLIAQRRAERTELNQIGGFAAAVLLDAVLSGTPIETNLPGPLGLPGGYPVRVSGPAIELRLPAGVSRADAIAFNQRAAAADGVVVDGDRVVFGPALAEFLPEAAEGFDIGDLDGVTARLYALRDRLRGEPPAQQRGGVEMPV